MAALGFLGFLSMSSQRMCMDVAMVCMINQTALGIKADGSVRGYATPIPGGKGNGSHVVKSAMDEHCASVPAFLVLNTSFSFSKVCISRERLFIIFQSLLITDTSQLSLMVTGSLFRF